MRIYLKIATLLSLVGWILAAQTSQVNTYINGNTLTADQLNSEFSNIYSTINNLDNANLTSGSNIDPLKISAVIDGSGIARQGDGSLDVNVDGVTVKSIADQIVISDLPGSAIVAGGGTTTQIADNTIAKVDTAIVTTAATATLGNVALSSGTGASLLTYTSGASGDMPNNLVNLTTQGGPVRVMIVPGTDATNSYIECEDATTDFCEIELTRAGSTVIKIPFFTEGGKYRLPPGAFNFIDLPAAGTYEYKIKYSVPSATALRVLNIRLLAYEM